MIQLNWVRTSLLFVFLLGIGSSTFAQENGIFKDEYREYREAHELYDHAKYSAAQEKFEQVIAHIGDPQDEIQVNAEYYAALCALELYNKDAEFRLREFVRNHPESPRVRVVYFQLGRYHYRRRKFKDAIAYFEKVDKYDLDMTDVAEYHFKFGYSYFQEEKMDKAKEHFYEIKSVESEYKAPATYYYSHISYSEGNYQTALVGFKELEHNKNFKAIVPYYIAQIYYEQQEYEKLIEYAPVLDTLKAKKESEIARLIGESYYRTQNYKDAIPYLEKYHEDVKGSREDYYQLGYAYYRGGDFKNALYNFERVVGKKDHISQNTYYHMGDCYLKLDEKNYARNAFRAASKLDHIEEIKEDALFNYAKLAYELSYNPYDEAITAFQEYINDNPESERVEEAYEFLLNVYMTTRNYGAAMESLEKIKNKDIRMRSAYQIVAYNHSVELFHNKKYDEAITAFQKVKTYPMERSLTARSTYWTAEAFYAKRDFDTAIVIFERFKLEPGAALLPQKNLSYYNVGYCHFQKKDFKSAITSFRNFVGNSAGQDAGKISDANIRLGDCYYITKDDVNAISYYSKAISTDKGDVAYALYQVALCYGNQDKQSDKIANLKKVMSKYPGSKYVVNVKFELGEAYRLKEDLTQALKYYTMMVEDHPNNLKVRKALANIANLQFRLKDYAAAEKTYKRILDQHRSPEDRAAALEGLRDVCVAIDNIEKFNDYVKQYGGELFPQPKLDSTNYFAAEKYYIEDQNCEKTILAFTQYLESFTPAIFAVNAHYYRGDCYHAGDKFEQALKDYNFVANEPSNLFTETALVRAARINHYEFKRYQEAIAHYSTLEKSAEFKDNVLAAQTGQMRCFYELMNYQSAMEYATKVLNDSKTEESTKVEAHLIKGTGYMEMGQTEQALKELDKTTNMTKSIFGAEAKYKRALIFYNEAMYKQSEKEIFELVQQKPSYDHWIARGYILLSDNYVMLGDTFQAKHTLQSIIDHHEDPELVRMAQSKLDLIIAAENRGRTKSARADWEIEPDGFNNEGVKEERTPKEDKDKGSEDGNGGEVPEDDGGGGNDGGNNETPEEEKEGNHEK
jgi:tetratricopeptide (TPR) repeat protein